MPVFTTCSKEIKLMVCKHNFPKSYLFSKHFLMKLFYICSKWNCIKHNYTSTMTRKKPCHKSLSTVISEFMKCLSSWNNKIIISVNHKIFRILLREYLTVISNSQDTMAAAASLLQETQICNTHGMKLLSRTFPWRNGLIPL